MNLEVPTIRKCVCMSEGVLHRKKGSWGPGRCFVTGKCAGHLCLQLMLCSPLSPRELMEDLAFSIPVHATRGPASWLPYGTWLQQRYFIICSVHSLVTELGCCCLRQLSMCVCVHVCVRARVCVYERTRQLQPTQGLCLLLLPLTL